MVLSHHVRVLEILICMWTTSMHHMNLTLDAKWYNYLVSVPFDSIICSNYVPPSAVHTNWFCHMGSTFFIWYTFGITAWCYDYLMSWLPCRIQVFQMLIGPVAWAQALSVSHNIFGIHSAFLSARHWDFTVVSNIIWMTADKSFHLPVALITAADTCGMVVLQTTFIVATCILMAFFCFPVALCHLIIQVIW